MATITTPQVPTQTHHVRTALLAMLAAVVATAVIFGVWTLVDSDDNGTSSGDHSVPAAQLSPAEEIQMFTEASKGSAPVLSPAEEIQMFTEASKGSAPVLSPAEEIQMFTEASKGSAPALSPAEEVQMFTEASASSGPGLTVAEEVALLRGNR